VLFPFPLPPSVRKSKLVQLGAYLSPSDADGRGSARPPPPFPHGEDDDEGRGTQTSTFFFLLLFRPRREGCPTFFLPLPFRAISRRSRRHLIPSRDRLFFFTFPFLCDRRTDGPRRSPPSFFSSPGCRAARGSLHMHPFAWERWSPRFFFFSA